MQSEEVEKVELLIVGAGLCGLATALLLQDAGKSVAVLEARAVAGGRVRSVLDEDGGFLADLGPSWVWPMFQPVISKWINKLALSVFPQFDDGQAILDYGPDQEVKAAFIPGQDGNMRVEGGTQALATAMVQRLPDDAIRYSAIVKSISPTSEGVTVTLSDGSVLRAEKLIMALPPRITLKTIDWQIALPRELQHALDMMPTWMAPHAKVSVVYDKPFWREQGLSGRIASRAGPIGEAHDHCSVDGSVAALWGFIGWPHDMRAKMGDALKEQVLVQLQHCFGADSPPPASIHIEEWSADPFVSSPNDLSDPMHHPSVGPDILRQAHLEGRVYFAGSETAERSPGLIEGAFDAAERVAGQILK